MQEIDQNVQSTRRQLKADWASLRATHEILDEIDLITDEQYLLLNGEEKSAQEHPLILKAELLGDDEW